MSIVHVALEMAAHPFLTIIAWSGGLIVAAFVVYARCRKLS